MTSSSAKKQRVVCTALLLLASSGSLQAAQTVRELWDNVFTSGSDRPINQVNDGTTSKGFEPGVNWHLNRNTPLLQNAQNFNVGGVPGLPSTAGKNAGIWSQCFLSVATYTSLGFVDDGVYGATMDPRHWGVRQLAPEAQIDFNANGVHYFSFGVNHGGNSSVGIGFTAGTAESSRFVGTGFTRGSYLSYSMTNEFGPIELGNTVYISTGTLDQPDPSGTDLYGYGVMGQALVRAYATNGVGIHTGAGTLVGRLTTTAGGNAILEVAWIATGTPMPTSENDVLWDVTYSFNETSVMTHVLLWHNTLYNVWPYAESDAIRVGTRYVDVVGLENFRVVPLPARTNFAGTVVSLIATNAATAEAPSFQWRKDGVNLADVPGSISNSVGVATGAGLSTVRLSLLSTDPGTSGNYDVVISNVFGVVTSEVAYVSIQPTSPPVPPSDNPESATRLVHGYHTFTLDGLAGTPPFYYQWRHSTTNVPGATNQNLFLDDIQLADAGSFTCVITNNYGSATSLVATLTVLPLAEDSFTEAIMSRKPFAYWTLNETGTNVTFDYAGGHHGAIGVTNDPANDYIPTEQGVPGPRNKPFPGFDSNNTAMGVTNGFDNELNGGVIELPVTNMTIVGWVYPRGNQGANAGLIMSRQEVSDTVLFGLYYLGPNAEGHNTFTFRWQGIGGSDPTSGTYFPNANLYTPTNQWSFVAMSVNPTNVSLYVGYGGTLYETRHNAETDPSMGGVSEFSPLGPYENPWPLQFGRDDIPWAHRTDRNFNGLIDGVAIFGRTLTAGELESIYQAGAGNAVRLYATPGGGGTSVLSWINGLLLSAPDVGGPFSVVEGAMSPYHTVGNTNTMQFFQVEVADPNGVIVQ